MNMSTVELTENFKNASRPSLQYPDQELPRLQTPLSQVLASFPMFVVLPITVIEVAVRSPRFHAVNGSLVYSTFGDWMTGGSRVLPPTIPLKGGFE
jgi:hypothetical protein